MRLRYSFIVLFVFILIMIRGDSTFLLSTTALNLWFEKLIPSMFVAMVFVRVLYDTHLINILLRPMRGILNFIFHVDENGFSLVLSSLVLGFPTSALLVDEEVKRCSLDQSCAQRLINTCSFATPGFIIMTCGIALSGSKEVGIQLFLISMLSGFILLFITRRHPIVMKTQTYTVPPFFTILSNAITSSAKALFMIGGYLMITMCVLGVLLPFLPETLHFPLNVFIEFSNGSRVLSRSLLPLPLRYSLQSALLGFGGFCVHLQIMSMIEYTQLNYLKYLAYRILQAMICFLFAYWLFH